MDIWYAFTTCFELITTDYLFDVYSECDITYGEDVDSEVIEIEVGPVEEMVVDNVITGSLPTVDTLPAVDTLISGVSLISLISDGSDCSDSSWDEEDEFDPRDVKYRHLLLIAKVIGYPPKLFTENAREYYNRHDRLMRNPDIIPTLIRDLIADNYEMDPEECLAIEQFLLAGLCYLPEDRVTAEQALKLPWLKIESL
jgi:hypothetical protein